MKENEKVVFDKDMDKRKNKGSPLTNGLKEVVKGNTVSGYTK